MNLTNWGKSKFKTTEPPRTTWTQHIMEQVQYFKKALFIFSCAHIHTHSIKKIGTDYQNKYPGSLALCKKGEFTFGKKSYKKLLNNLYPTWSALLLIYYLLMTLCCKTSGCLYYHWNNRSPIQIDFFLSTNIHRKEVSNNWAAKDSAVVCISR